MSNRIRFSAAAVLAGGLSTAAVAGGSSTFEVTQGDGLFDNQCALVARDGAYGLESTSNACCAAFAGTDRSIQIAEDGTVLIADGYRAGRDSGFELDGSQPFEGSISYNSGLGGACAGIVGPDGGEGGSGGGPGGGGSGGGPGGGARGSVDPGVLTPTVQTASFGPTFDKGLG